MRDKLYKQGDNRLSKARPNAPKQRKGQEDEEIKSESDRADNGGFSDPFLAVEKETMNAEEKRLKMTKQVIAEFARNDNDDFFEKLQAKTTPEEQILNKEDDLLTRKMKMHLLESQGKLFYSIAEDFARCGEEEKAEMRAEEDEAPIVDDQFDRYFLKGHKKAITCLEWMPDN